MICYVERILGCRMRPKLAFMHEYFSFYAGKIVDELRIEAQCGNTAQSVSIQIIPYKSSNHYLFPMKGTVVVTDTYLSVNSHRWCRNSEYAFDVGIFDETMENVPVEGKSVYAASEGQTVLAGQMIGKVGSSGSSWLPHLHFHVMKDGMNGPGIPVVFENLKTFFGEPCFLEDTVNLVTVREKFK